MSKSSPHSAIRLKGVRHNNLKNFDLDLPLNQLIVITGLSGSGKSSLAFDTLFAEGQRRYIETFSPYVRQFFERMDKPQVDSIEGIPPAIAIEQRNAVKTTRSTVGTMTEICDYMKMLWPHVAQLHCRQCGRQVRKDSPQQIWEEIRAQISNFKSEISNSQEYLITFDLPLTEKLSLEESLSLVEKQGYQRLLLGKEIVRRDEFAARLGGSATSSKRKPIIHAAGLPFLTIIQDRLRPADTTRARFIEACEQAYHFGKGKLALREFNGATAKPGAIHLFSNRLHCAQCDLEYREPSPALFSFNHPLGACPACRGFGRIISIDYDLALPDRTRTLAQGVVKPWLTGTGAESQSDLMRACRHFEIPTNIPFCKLSQKWQKFVIEGESGYGADEEHQWPRAWYGVKGYFRWLESKAYKMHVRVLLSRYRAYTPCPDCHGKRFQPEALLYRIALSPSEARVTKEGLPSEVLLTKEGSTLADFYQLPIRDALQFIERLGLTRKSRPNEPVRLILDDVRSRLRYLDEVGLGYLTLDRPTRTLSGGETERVNLTTCIGTRLVNTLFVLDEPSVGLHPRDVERLVRILQELRDGGNTVVVVEHEASIMRAANQLVDLGPGHGATGGQVVFQGTFTELLKSNQSLTAQYLNGQKRIEIPQRRPLPARSLPLPLQRRKGGPGLRSAFDEGGGEEDSSMSENAAVMRDAIYLPPPAPILTLSHATCHNLNDVTVEFPLGRFLCVTGVSGSGKTTLIKEVLLPALAAQLRSNDIPQLKPSARLPSEPNGEEHENQSDKSYPSDPSELPSDPNDAERENSSTALEGPDTSKPGAQTLSGSEHLECVVLVDQSILGKTPRSNPAVYIGAFDSIRDLFAQSDLAKQRGLNASAFSFNSAQGQCERCRGAGFEKIEMQFLSDVFIRCPDCNGRRYRAHILEVKLGERGEKGEREERSLSIADLLESTIEEAIEFLKGFAESATAQRAVASLKLLEEVGLGYLRLGQPINTLSGGESQRLKLVKHLAEHGASKSSAGARGGTLFLFDEPTTGLHFDDVRLLLKVFQRLVDAGHSVLVIEHNLDVIKSADWIIDLGPDAGDRGGQIVAAGTPEELAGCAESHTGKALRAMLGMNGTTPNYRTARRLNYKLPTKS
jgi:excinuclease ABC subunit A